MSAQPLLSWDRLEKNKFLDTNLTVRKGASWQSINDQRTSSLLLRRGKGKFVPYLPKANFQSQVCKDHFMCRAAILLLTDLIINPEFQNEEIKVLIVCTKFLWYFSSLSYHWERFSKNCLIKIAVLSSLVYYLQDMLIWLNTFLVTGPEQPPAQCSGSACLRPPHCHVKQPSSSLAGLDLFI